ncbi:VOC family protein [Streptomyces sp. NPDC050095]|uniref:VOC family protein n=1 Tax=unclassified Streptomyces TaxID=2593676 RepID=UPI00342E9406
MGLITTGAIVLDCADPDELARFYIELLDAERCPDATVNRTDIETSGGLRMGFRRDLNATPASWPRPEDSLQTHLDFLADADDVDELERRVVSLGGLPIEASGRGGPSEARLYADPAGHTFTIRASLHHGPKVD